MVQLTNPAELARQTSMAKVKVGGKRVVEFNGDAYMAIKYESFGPLCWLPVIALTAKLSSPDRETWCIVKFAWASRMCNSCHIFFSLKQANWESAIIRDTHQLAFFLCWLISVVSVQLLALGTHFVSVWHWVTLSLCQWHCRCVSDTVAVSVTVSSRGRGAGARGRLNLWPSACTVELNRAYFYGHCQKLVLLNTV